MNENQAKEWGERLRVARQKTGMNQVELADKAQVAIRTLFRAEKGAAIPGSEIITRLALALKEDPSEWVLLAGLKPLSEPFVNAMKDRLASQGKQPKALNEKLLCIRERINENHSNVLICVCYASAPTGIRSDEIIIDVVELIHAGAFFAMFLPFPVCSLSTSCCALMYRQIGDEVITLAEKYRNAIGDQFHNHLQLYAPIIRDLLIVPPPSSIVLRPMLIKYALHNSADDLEIGAIIETPTSQGPHWYETDDIGQKKAAWKDYFKPAIENWTGLEWKDGESNSSWAQYDFIEKRFKSTIAVDEVIKKIPNEEIRP